MGNTRQTGGMEVRLTADTADFVRAIQQAEVRLKSLQTQVQAMPAALKKWLDQETGLTNKIEEKRLQIMALDGTLSAQAEQYTALEKAMGRLGEVGLESVFAEQSRAMEEATTQLDLLQSKLTQAQAQQAGGQWEAALDPQPQRDYAAAVSTTADSLSALSPVLSDSMSGIGGLASKIGSFIPVLSAAGEGGAAMGTAILGGVGIVLAGAGVVLDILQKMEEEHRKALQAAWDALDESEARMQTLNASLGVLDSQSASLSDVASARKDLVDLFPQMVLGYDEEGNAILRNGDALKEQIELLNKKTELQRKKVLNEDDGEALRNYSNARQEVQELQERIRKESEHRESIREGYEKFAPMYEIDFETSTILLNKMYSELNDKQLELLAAEEKAREILSLQIEDETGGIEELDKTQRTVADNMIEDAVKKILAIEDENDRLATQKAIIEEIRAVLGDEKEVTDRYNLIVGTQAKDEAKQAAEHRARVGRVYEALVDEAREAAEKTYTDSVEAATAEVNATYETRKKGLQAETDAVQDALKAQQSAYQRLKFDVRTLDEQDLANKLDLLDRQLAAEKDAQVQAVMAVQQRYYEEARLIVETANREIQVHRDKLTALDEADRQAEEARTARQNAAKLRDLNERYAKQQGENEREMAEKTKEYEEKREALLAVIAAPPSRTAGILAQRELDELDAQWTQEREGLELDHADKLLQIQRQLDEEKLTQQEEEEAAKRQRERDRLNEQIIDLQSNAEQQLIILSNRYTVEKDIQQTALAEQLKAEQDHYQRRLDELNVWKDRELETRKQRAAAIRDAAVQEENLTEEAIQRIENASYQERLDMLDQYGIDAAQKAEAIKKRIIDIFDSPPRSPETVQYSVDRNLRRGIPAFAQGGIVSQPTLAMVGEGGEPEAILPLSRLNTLIMDPLAKQEADKERLLANAYYTFLPIMARFGLSPDGSRITTNNNQRSVTYNIEKVEINHPNDAKMATAQLESLCGGW